MDGQLKQVVFEKDIRTSLLHIHIPFLINEKTEKKVGVLKQNELK